MKFSAPCLLGLEGLVANELKFCGIENVKSENGRVLFEGDTATLARANISSRFAERILILLDEFTATDFETLFERVKKIPWQDYIGINDAFPVKGSSVSSKLSSVPACQKIIKKAVVEKLKERYNISWFDETQTLVQIQFLIFKDKVSIMLDTSGSGLHKRGYRENSNSAPIRETLAAAMADLSRVRGNHTVVDPFCGSGTILIESALKAMNIMPGINRNFAFEEWEFIDKNLVNIERERAKENEKRDCVFVAYGYDIDSRAISLAKENAQKAGVSEKIIFSQRDIKDFEEDFDFCSVITNPPYGERMLDIEKAREIYKVMGKKFLQKPHHSYTIISPDEEFEKCFERVADKKRKLYNGMIKCNVFMYYKGIDG